MITPVKARMLRAISFSGSITAVATAFNTWLSSRTEEQVVDWRMQNSSGSTIELLVLYTEP